MKNIIQKKMEILQNEVSIFSEINTKCNEQNFLKELIKNNVVIQVYKVNDIFVYALKREKGNSRQITVQDSTIFSALELNSITEKDFEDEEYFTTTDNVIGYNTKIKSGFWILLKNNEIRYTLKNYNKKIAVIQIKKNNENSIEQKVFSYSSQIENKILECMNKNVSIMETLTEVILDINMQEEICKIEEILENKSIKLLVKEFELLMKQIKEQKNENNSNEKLFNISRKYQKILMDLTIEKENMIINVARQQIPANRALILIEQKSNCLEKILKAIRILFKVNEHKTHQIIKGEELI